MISPKLIFPNLTWSFGLSGAIIMLVHVWENASKPASKFVPLTLAFGIYEYKNVQTSSHQPSHQSVQQWTKPSLGFIKLNVDVAFNQATGVVSIRGVFLDSDGMFLRGFYHFAHKYCFCKT